MGTGVCVANSAEHARNMAGMIRSAVESSRDDKWPATGRMSKNHVVWMMDRVMFVFTDPAKMHRWVGWAQCCLFSAGVMKEGELEQLTMDAYVYPTDFVRYRYQREGR